MTIRTPRHTESEPIRQIYLAAFGENEREAVADLAVALLLAEGDSPEILNLVADIEGDLVGHVAFSAVKAKGEEGVLAYLLAPLAVSPQHQKRGIGSSLVRDGLRVLGDQEVDRFLVYGDPEYYGRFGFQADLAESYLPPFPLEFPFGWLGLPSGEPLSGADSVAIECVEPLNRSDLW